jgi:hypothetical protein
MKCKSCGLEKDPSLFYNGIKSECKECVKIRTKRNRKEKEDYYKEYDRNRPNSEERNQRNIERVNKNYPEDPVFRQKIQETKKEWAARNKHKRKAQSAVSNAVRDGKLTNVVSCEHCGTSEKKIQGHHWSYLPEHWLDVSWLCTTCHGKEHRRLNELGRDPDKTEEVM